MIDERDICGMRLEVRGETAPHEFELTVVGFIREQVGDAVVEVMREHGDKMAPDIAAAMEREILARMRRKAATKGKELEDIEI